MEFLSSFFGVQPVKNPKMPSKGPERLSNRSKAITWAKNALRLKTCSATPRIKKTVKKCDVPKPDKKFKQAWREFGGRRIYYRSSWESNVGRYLQWQKERGEIQDWFHEPKTFWFDGIKRGCVTYLPDFQIVKLDGTHEWLEVKGFMDAKSKTKIARFRKYFPEEKLRILDAKWYNLNKEKLSLIIPGWEKG